MFRDKKSSSDLLNLSQLQLHHKTLDDFRERLSTYEDYWWFAKPDQISAIQCSRKGWQCISNDLIECVNCHARLFAILPSILNTNEYTDAVQTTSKQLVDAHEKYCVWKVLTIPESILQIQDIYSNETINQLISKAKDLSDKILHIEIVGEIKNKFTLETKDIDERYLFIQYLNDPKICAAFKIVTFGWILSKDGILICEKCCREITNVKKKLVFDPVYSHRSWCPILKKNSSYQYEWLKLIEQIQIVLKDNNNRAYQSQIKPVKSNKEQTAILSDLVSTQNLFHELISGKDFHRFSLQSSFTTDTYQDKTKT